MKQWMVCLGLFSMAAGQVLAGGAEISFGGQLSLADPACSFSPIVFLPSWSSKSGVGGFLPEKDGSRSFEIRLRDQKAKGMLQVKRLPSGVLDVDYSLVFEKDVTLNTLCVSLSLQGKDFFGGEILSEGKSTLIPFDQRNAQLFSRHSKSFTLVAADRKRRVKLDFPQSTHAMLQDNRAWGSQALSLRISLGGDRPFRAGKKYQTRFTVSTHEPLVLASQEPVIIRAGKEWIPLTVEPTIQPGSALDFSGLMGARKPAGEYGYVVAKGEDFEFEKLPGVSQRFYGVNLCFTANFQKPDVARKFARHLARIGYNALRIHHYERGLTQGMADGTTIHAEQLAKMDALMAACVENGIYVTTDLFVSRSVPYRTVGIDRDGVIPMDEYKMLLPIHEGAYQNLLVFSRQWLNHVNPYTGRRYADEPALSWLAIVNEGNPGNFGGGVYRQIPEWCAAWKKWVAQKRAAGDPLMDGVKDEIPENMWEQSPTSVAFWKFLQEKEEQFTLRVKAFLRDEMRCKALITGMSCWSNPVSAQLTRARVYDYVDDHFYVDHPSFLQKSWSLPSRCANQNPISGSNMGAQGVTYRRLLDKPFTITEYNYSGPGRFRGVGGIATGATAALQNWDGLWRFAWSHSIGSIERQQSATMGYFDMAGDPLSLAAERASICLFLRRDLPVLKKTYALVVPEKAVRDAKKTTHCSGAWPWISWYAKFGTIVADAAPAGCDWSSVYPDAYRLKATDIRESVLGIGPKDPMPAAGDGAVEIDQASGTFLLKTPRTCGGFAECGIVSADSLVADLGKTAATIWVSSLDERPIRETSRLLVTHLTDVQNTEIKYADQQLKILLKWGRIPHLMRNGDARVMLRLAADRKWKVYSLTTGGARRVEVPSRFKEGRLAFKADVDADPAQATFLYEVVAE